MDRIVNPNHYRIAPKTHRKFHKNRWNRLGGVCPLTHAQKKYIYIYMVLYKRNQHKNCHDQTNIQQKKYHSWQASYTWTDEDNGQMFYLEHYILWFRDLDTKKIRAYEGLFEKFEMWCMRWMEKINCQRK